MFKFWRERFKYKIVEIKCFIYFTYDYDQVTNHTLAGKLNIRYKSNISLKKHFGAIIKMIDNLKKIKIMCFFSMYFFGFLIWIELVNDF